MNEAVKPNVLFLMSDEHRFDVSGFAGNKIVRTPVLDFLADGAAVFDNAYTPSPVCIPARQCLAAGQYPRHCRVEEYGEDLPSGYPTFAKWFGEEGYVTAAAGKLHHMGTDQMQGWRIRLAGDTQVGECYYREQKEYKIKREGGGIRGKWDEKKKFFVQVRVFLPMRGGIALPFRLLKILFMSSLWTVFMTGQILENRFFCMWAL